MADFYHSGTPPYALKGLELHGMGTGVAPVTLYKRLVFLNTKFGCKNKNLTALIDAVSSDYGVDLTSPDVLVILLGRGMYVLPKNPKLEDVPLRLDRSYISMIKDDLRRVGLGRGWNHFSSFTKGVSPYDIARTLQSLNEVILIDAASWAESEHRFAIGLLKENLNVYAPEQAFRVTSYYTPKLCDSVVRQSWGRQDLNAELDEFAAFCGLQHSWRISSSRILGPLLAHALKQFPHATTPERLEGVTLGITDPEFANHITDATATKSLFILACLYQAVLAGMETVPAICDRARPNLNEPELQDEILMQICRMSKAAFKSNGPDTLSVISKTSCRLASFYDVVSQGVDRLLDLGLVAIVDKQLRLTEAGRAFVELLPTKLTSPAEIADVLCDRSTSYDAPLYTLYEAKEKIYELNLEPRPQSSFSYTDDFDSSILDCDLGEESDAGIVSEVPGNHALLGKLKAVEDALDADLIAVPDEGRCNPEQEDGADNGDPVDLTGASTIPSHVDPFEHMQKPAKPLGGMRQRMTWLFGEPKQG